MVRAVAVVAVVAVVAFPDKLPEKVIAVNVPVPGTNDNFVLLMFIVLNEEVPVGIKDG